MLLSIRLIVLVLAIATPLMGCAEKAIRMIEVTGDRQLAVQCGGEPCSSIEPALISPLPDSRLRASDVTFRWVANDTKVQTWWMYIGSSQGSYDIASTGMLEAAFEARISGLPTDGRTLWVRLWYKDSQGWKLVDTRYTALQKARAASGTLKG